MNRWIVSAGTTLTGALLLAGQLSCGTARPLSAAPGGGGQAGYALEITGATVQNGKVAVTYQIKNNGQPSPLPVCGNAATGTCQDTRWTLAELTKDPDTGLDAYRSLILQTGVSGQYGTVDQPTFENNGTLEDLGNGTYRYTYATELPAGDDLSLTHRAGVFARFQTAAATGGAAAQYAPQQPNVVFDFVPAGGTPQTLEVVAASSCDQCHGEVRAHGGFRRGTLICTTCHTYQLADPETQDPANPGQPNPISFTNLVHRIHRGQDLPTLAALDGTLDPNNPLATYEIVGFRGAHAIFGKIVTDPATGAPTRAGLAFPQDIRNCNACHGGAPQGGAHLTAVSQQTCQSCHSDVVFDTGKVDSYHRLHTAGVQVNGACTSCHTSGPATPENEYTADVAGAHTPPNLSAEYNPISIAIGSVSAAPGKMPTVTFTLKNKDGSVPNPIGINGGANPSGVETISITFAGPTTPDDLYANVIQESVPLTLAPDPSGSYTYTFTQKSIPAGATGTWMVGMEARRTNQALTTHEESIGLGTVYDSAVPNPVSYFAVAGGPTIPRRTVVATSQCDTCHQQLAAHGELRHSTEYCVFCHAVDGTDAHFRSVSTDPIIDGLAQRTIHFKVMIHKIHTGEDLDLSLPYVIYGFRTPTTGRANVFAWHDSASGVNWGVRFPGTRARCEKCHVLRNDQPTFTIEAIPPDALATQNMQATGGSSPTTAAFQPITAACLACHDTQSAHEHAASMTQGGVEGCAACHSQGASQSVIEVHAASAF
jgi:OmcA/MtrC family decaheme c-type cytochrome